MKSNHLLLAFMLTVISLVLYSCDKTKESETESVSVIGTWEYSSSEYYYDGCKIEYNQPIIGVCDSSQILPVIFYNAQGLYTFKEDSTGCFYSETGDTKITLPFSYSVYKDDIKFIFENTTFVHKAIIENGKLKIVGNYEDINGWVRNDNRDKVIGADGKKNHKLEAISYHSKI